MKFTSILLASAVFAISAQASAFDLMHPFWGPAKNQVASDTTYSFTRTNAKHEYNGYGAVLTEKLLYGITDNWTVFGSIGRNWSKAKPGIYNAKRDSWSLGTSYNIINDGKNFLQAAFDYVQARNNDRVPNETAKSYTVTGTYGYNFAQVTPYVKVTYGNYVNLGSENDSHIGVTVAAYKKLADKVGANLGVEYNHHTSSNVKGEYDLTADVSYQFTKKVALKAFGRYMLDQKEKGRDWTQNQYTIGADLKVAF